MYLYKWLIDEEQKLPKEVQGKKVAIRSYRGVRNGNSWHVDIIDIGSREQSIIATLEFPSNFAEGLFNEYMMFCLQKVGLNVNFDPAQLEKELACIKERGYTMDNAENPSIDRQESPHREPGLRPQRMVDEPLDISNTPAETSFDEAARRLREQQERARLGQAVPERWGYIQAGSIHAGQLVGIAVEQGQSVPNVGTGITFRTTTNDFFPTYDINTLRWTDANGRHVRPISGIDEGGNYRVQWEPVE